MRELAAAGPALRAADVAARGGQARSSPQRGEPLKVQLIDEKTAGQREVSCYTIKDRDTFVDFCVGPHVPSTGRLKAFKLLTHVERLLEGRRAATSRCSASTARRSSREKELKAHLHADRGSEEARPPQARHASSGCSCSTRGRRARRSGWRKGTTLYNTLANYMRERALPGRLRRGEDAARLQQGAVGDVRPLAALPPEHVPRRVARASRWALKAMNCPGPLPGLRAARCAATATCRSASTSRRRCTATRRPACSSGLTRVRQFSQDDAHCFVMEDRRSARRSSGCCGSCSASTATSASTPEMKLSTRPAGVPRRGRDVGPRRGAS